MPHISPLNSINSDILPCMLCYCLGSPHLRLIHYQEYISDASKRKVKGSRCKMVKLRRRAFTNPTSSYPWNLCFVKRKTCCFENATDRTDISSLLWLTKFQGLVGWKLMLDVQKEQHTKAFAFFSMKDIWVSHIVDKEVPNRTSPGLHRQQILEEFRFFCDRTLLQYILQHINVWNNAQNFSL